MKELLDLQKFLQSHYDAMDNARVANTVIGPNADAETYRRGVKYALDRVNAKIRQVEGESQLNDIQRAFYKIKDAIELLSDPRAKCVVAYLKTTLDQVCQLADRETK